MCSETYVDGFGPDVFEAGVNHPLFPVLQHTKGFSKLLTGFVQIGEPVTDVMGLVHAVVVGENVGFSGL